MKKLNNNEIKKIQLEMLKYIDDICQKNKINYTLIGGSLIGAIRHKGMIPWDDDIDIGLTRDEYQKLIKVLKENDNKDFSILDYETNPKYYFAFPKLVCNYTKLIEKDFDEIEGYGIYIDIFCYNNVPDNVNEQIKYYRKEMFLNKMLGGMKKVNKGTKGYFLKLCRYIFVRFIGPKRIFKKLNKLHNKYNDIETNSMISTWPVYKFEKELKTKDIFRDYKRTMFDGIEVSITTKYDKFLKGTFKDYMELPPVEKRVTHGLTVYMKDEK